LNWRRWNNILHRDIGYLAAGLTAIFAISGIAVNHLEDWNPNYKIEKVNFTLKHEPNKPVEEIAEEIVRKLKIDKPVESTFRPSQDVLQIFFENESVELNLFTGEGVHEFVSERAVLYDFNFLHLNHAKKVWTYVSDLYAVALLFLAVSGLFVLKGRKGIKGRGAWLTGIGILIPLFFLIIYKYF
jgi:hypothetical protein